MSLENTLLEIDDLKTYFYLEEGDVRAVDGVSFSMNRQEVVGVVGESGCGKSVLARSIMRIVQPPGETIEGNITYHKTTNSASKKQNYCLYPITGRKFAKYGAVR